MKKKQLIGIVVTGAVIIAVGFFGVLSNVVSKKILENSEQATEFSFNSILDSVESTIDLPENDYIGVLNIVGEISSGSSNISSSDAYNHELYMDYVDKMEKSDNNKGILIYVDSPGGGVYESDELYLKLMEYKKKTNRPVWAYFASQACSGGYYISMAADKIYANRNTMTGSIGVIFSTLNCKELYDKIGIKEIDITSGKNKAMGSAGLELTDEQREILQSYIDEAYDQFVGIVSEGRKMDEGNVRTLADGRIYTAKQAKENGLIDEIGQLKDAKKAFQKEFDLDSDIEYYSPDSSNVGMLGNLFGKIQEILPKSKIDLADDIINNQGNGVLKYYAK